MKCLEHGEETNYLSVFDSRTAAWYEHFYAAVHAHFGDKNWMIFTRAFLGLMGRELSAGVLKSCGKEYVGHSHGVGIGVGMSLR